MAALKLRKYSVAFLVQYIMMGTTTFDYSPLLNPGPNVNFPSKSGLRLSV